MAFDPSKYPAYTKRKTPVNQDKGFDPSKYEAYTERKAKVNDIAKYQAGGPLHKFVSWATNPVIDLSTSEKRKGAMDYIKDQALATEDMGKGALASFQDLGNWATYPLPDSMRIPKYDPHPSSSHGNLPIEIGKFGGALASGTEAERLGASFLEEIGQIPSLASRLAGGGLGGLISSEALGESKPALSSLLGVAGAGVPEFGMRALGRYLTKNQPIEEFEAARATVPDGIRVPIGELTNSPEAKRDYGRAMNVWLSGANKPYDQLFNYLNKGTRTLGEGAQATDNANQYIYDDLAKKYMGLKENTDNAYKDFREYADSNRKSFNRNKYDDYINSKINDIKKEQERGGTSERLNEKRLKELEELKEGEINSFRDADLQRKDINEIIREKTGDNPNYDKKLLMGAKDALDRSMAESAKNSEDPLLFEKHRNALNSRIAQGEMENIDLKTSSPFYKIYAKNGDTGSLIDSYLKQSSGTKDYSGLLSNLTNHLSEDGRKVLAKHWISPTNTESVAQKVNRISKLNPAQRQMVFGENAPLADELANIGNTFGESKIAGWVPKTGYTGSKVAQGIATLGLGLGATHLGGLALGGALAAAMPGLSYLTQQALRSNALKDLAAQYLRSEARKAITQPNLLGQSARTLALQQLGDNQ